MATAVRAPDTVPAASVAEAPDASRSRHSRVVRYALGLIALQLAVRGWVAASGGFYWDDLILVGRSGQLPLWSAELLLHDHDGHLIPGTYVIAWIVTHLAPYEWWAAATSLVLLQALASVAVLRLLRRLSGTRPALLVPLTFYLFSPLTLPSFAWWTTGLNSLTLQAALAWVAADAVLLVRTGRRRYAVSGVVAFALSLAVFEKSLLVPCFALAVVFLLLRVTGATSPLRTALIRGRALWLPVLGVVAVWDWAYLSYVGSPSKSDGGTAAQAVEMIGRGVTHAFLPTLVGGPWTWDQLLPSMPWSAPPLALVALSGLLAGGVVVWTTMHRCRTGLVWLMVAGYVAACLVAMVLGRVDANTHVELPQTLRYVSDGAVVVAAAIALVLAAPEKERRALPLLTPRGRRVLVPAGVVLFLVSAGFSTASFTRAWSDTPPTEYLTNAVADLQSAGPAPLLDQVVPEEVLGSLTYPHNLASMVFSPVPGSPGFATATPRLRMLDASGRLVDATVTPIRVIPAGPVPDCGHLISGAEITRIPFTEANLMEWGWTVRLDYVANRDGVVEVYLPVGESVHVPVARGPHTVFIQLLGGGDELRLHSLTEDLSLCLPQATLGHTAAAPGG